MPIIKSAKKRSRQADKATIRNAKTKRQLREAIKAFIKKPTKESFDTAQSNIDKAVKKNIIHKNKAARKKQQLAKKAKDAKVVINQTSKKSPAKSKGATKDTKASAGAKKAPKATTTTKKAPTSKAAKKPATKTKKTSK